MPNVSFPILFIVILFCWSCNNGGTSSGLRGYTGVPNEVIVVMNNAEWKGALGDIVKKKLRESVFGLPQPEARFDLVNISASKFNNLFRPHRNLIIFEIDEKNPGIEYKRNVWANGQLLIRISGKTKGDYIKIFNEHADELTNLIETQEINRLRNRNKKFGSKTLCDKIFDHYKYRLKLQKDAYIATEQEDVLWMRIERERPLGGYQHQISQGLIVYTYPYTDTLMFTKGRILAVRDSILKKYIPGGRPKSYMKTSHKLYEPAIREVSFKGMFAVETRGLWNMENDFMGGPFYSLTFFDEKNNRMITAEGYVFAPQFDKRNFLLEVEAIVKSIEI